MRPDQLFSGRSLSIFFGALTGAVLLTSCAKTESKDIKTDGMYTSFQVTRSDDGLVKCSASFHLGSSSGALIELSGGDRVTCNGVAMGKSSHATEYETQVRATDSGEYVISFERPSEAVMDSNLQMPAQIIVYSPANGATLRRSSALGISWLPSQNQADSFSVSLLSETNVAKSASGTVIEQTPESGHVALQSPMTALTNSSDFSSAITIQLTRTRAGSLDPLLKGEIAGKQVRRIGVTLRD